MPRPRQRLAGIILAALVVVLVAACGKTGPIGAHPTPGPAASSSPGTTPTGAPVPSPTPTPALGPPAAPQSLSFAGDVDGTMTTLAAQSSSTPSACGERPVEAAAWASTLYGSVNGTLYGFVATVKPYNGPGTYSQTQAQVQLFSISDQQKGWESLPGDPVAFTVNNDDQTGTVEATLTNLSSNQSTLTVTGDWSCAA